jgi:glycosyltransferase involved in cell wall biosynthesis
MKLYCPVSFPLQAMDCSDMHMQAKVSIIVPARNEEKYIGKCLTSLLEQDYPTFEIVAVNDLSSDMTGRIMNEYRVKDSKRISVINIVHKPDDWVGKNWACYQDYLKSSGEVLNFTDADTVYSRHTVSLAFGQLIEQILDALTARPTLLLKSVWRSIIFPLLWRVLFFRLSSIDLNAIQRTPASRSFLSMSTTFSVDRKRRLRIPSAATTRT